MQKNAINDFHSDLYLFLTGEHCKAQVNLIKKHDSSFDSIGEFSFPASVNSWIVIKGSSIQNEQFIFEYIKKESIDLVNISKTWNLPIFEVKLINNRVHLFLERKIAIYNGLSENKLNISILTNQILSNNINIKAEVARDSNDITLQRLKYLKGCIENLCSVVQYKPNDDIIISCKTYPQHKVKHILCGAVLNAKTGLKETEKSVEEYIRLRQTEMTLIAQHKYGVRVKTETKWNDFLQHLGESAVAFELLQTKPSSAVKIDFGSASTGSSKGASFVLYNCARLETIIRTFNEKVNAGVYPPLPDYENIDFTHLNQEEEWKLIFNYLMGLPCLLESCVDASETHCEFRPHFICNFLSSMVKVFSQYYRKTRILVEPRKHLLPVIFARMHLVKLLNETIKFCLKLLNIKSVSQM